jgi:hypothetical protein
MTSGVLESSWRYRRQSHRALHPAPWQHCVSSEYFVKVGRFMKIRCRVIESRTDAIVRNVVDEPGGLPLLSTTLLDLWQRRDGRTLLHATYLQVGGVSGAVSRLAEAAYGRLTPSQQVVARAVFLRLASGGSEGAPVVRRPAPIGEFDADHQTDAAEVLATLTDSRLLTVSEGTVEISHEALLRDWPRLRGWLEEDAEGRRLREHLSAAAREWDGSREDPAELDRGARLAAILDWAAAHAVELNELERRFIDASRAAGEQEAERQRRTNPAVGAPSPRRRPRPGSRRRTRAMGG